MNIGFSTIKGALAATIVAAGLSMTLVFDATAEETFQMRIQTAVPSGAMSFEMLERFATRLDTMSQGRLQVRVLGAGAIVPSPRILDSVHAGTIEAGFAWPQFWAGKHPATALFSNTPIWPMAGLDQLTHFAWMYEGGGLELYQDLLENEIGVNVVSLFVTPSGWQPLGWFNQPIENMETFRQLRYRAPPGLAGEIFSEAGVTAVFMPGEEIIPSAERGVIDGAEWINPVEDYPFGFHQVFEYYYLASIHQFIDVGEIVINRDFWDSLPADLQEMTRTAAQATIMDTFVADIARNSEMIRMLQEEHGITVSATPPDVHAALMEAADSVLQRHSSDNEFFREVVNAQQEFARATQPWWGEVLRIYYQLSEDAKIR